MVFFSGLAASHPLLNEVAEFRERVRRPASRQDERRAVRSLLGITEGRPQPRRNTAFRPTGSIRPHSPSVSERIGDFIGGVARRAGFSNAYAGRLTDEADLLPVVGDIAGAEDAATAFRRGAIGEGIGLTAMAALGVVPGIGDVAATGGRRAIRAWHGSPYDFDRFDTANIGRGEGNTAFGTGLYFADRRGVAGNYAVPRGAEPRDVPPEVTSELRTALRDVDYLGFDNLGQAVQAIRSQPTDFSQVWEMTGPEADRIRNAFNAFEGARWPAGQRPRLYEVDINAAPERLLDWERPLIEQPARDLFPRYIGDLEGRTGQQFVNSLGRRDAEILQSYGVQGIQYLDGTSRALGGGSRNYVIFDPNIVDVVGKY